MKAIGIILAAGNSKRMGQLTNHRAVAAMPIGGTFRAIDYTLSSMANSNIERVAVITQFNSQSIKEHLNSAKWWDFGRKQGGLSVFSPSLTQNNPWWYRGTADSLVQNIRYLKRSHEPYVIIAPGDCVYKLDYGHVLDQHIDSGADITVVVKEVSPDMDVTRFGNVVVNKEGRITEFYEKPPVAMSNTISTGIYVIRRRVLITLLEGCQTEDHYDLVQDILIRQKEAKKMHAYYLTSYWHNIATIDDFFNTNMDFLDKNIRSYFREEPTIQTKVKDLPPAKYNFGSRVSDSIVSGGCIINGSVEHSVLCQNVYVERGAFIKNCVILDGAYIDENAFLENCIVEGEEVIAKDQTFVGENQITIVNNQKKRYEA